VEPEGNRFTYDFDDAGDLVGVQQIRLVTRSL
jgi:hypothetical protein